MASMDGQGVLRNSITLKENNLARAQDNNKEGGAWTVSAKTTKDFVHLSLPPISTSYRKEK